MCVQAAQRNPTGLTWKTATGTSAAFLHTCGVCLPVYRARSEDRHKDFNSQARTCLGSQDILADAHNSGLLEDSVVAKVPLGWRREARGRGTCPGLPAALLSMRQPGKRIITIRQKDKQLRHSLFVEKSSLCSVFDL